MIGNLIKGWVGGPDKNLTQKAISRKHESMCMQIPAHKKKPPYTSKHYTNLNHECMKRKTTVLEGVQRRGQEPYTLLFERDREGRAAPKLDDPGDLEAQPGPCLGHRAKRRNCSKGHGQAADGRGPLVAAGAGPFPGRP